MKYFDYKSRHSVAAIRKLKPHLSADRVASYPDHVRLLRVVAQDNFIIYCLLGFINMSFLILSNSWELPTPAVMLVGRPNWILGPGPNPGSAGIWGHVNWVARWLSLWHDIYKCHAGKELEIWHVLLTICHPPWPQVIPIFDGEMPHAVTVKTFELLPDRGWIWLDFLDFKHDLLKEVYQSGMCLQRSTLSFLAGCPKSHFLGWYRNFLVYWYSKLDNQVVNSTCPKDKLGWIWRADNS